MTSVWFYDLRGSKLPMKPIKINDNMYYYYAFTTTSLRETDMYSYLPIKK